VSYPTIAKLIEKLYICAIFDASSSFAERKDLILHQFGTLMLELITGQSSINESTDLMQLIDESPLNISMDNLIDPDLGNNYNFKELRSLLSLARLCMKTKNKSTFSISHVFLYLQKAFDKT